MKVSEEIKKVISIIKDSEKLNLKVVDYYDKLNNTYNIYHNRKDDNFTDEENTFIDNLLYEKLDSKGIINYSFGYLYDFYDFKYDFEENVTIVVDNRLQFMRDRSIRHIEKSTNNFIRLGSISLVNTISNHPAITIVEEKVNYSFLKDNSMMNLNRDHDTGELPYQAKYA